MDRGKIPNARSLTRVFMPGVDMDGPFELPGEARQRLSKVLRLRNGDYFAALPGDGRMVVCQLEGLRAVPVAIETPGTESELRLTIAQALTRPEKLETTVRMGTEIGVHRFLVFPASRSLVSWDQRKLEQKLERLQAIAVSAAEQSYRTHVPEVRFVATLKHILSEYPDALVASESQTATLASIPDGAESCVVIGPEGGWDPVEVNLIGDRAASFGPLVLRTETAGPAIASLFILGSRLSKRR